MSYVTTMYIGTLEGPERALARRVSDDRYTIVNGHVGSSYFGYDPEDPRDIVGYEEDGESDVALNRQTVVKNATWLKEILTLDLDANYSSPLHDLSSQQPTDNCFIIADNWRYIYEDVYGKPLRLFDFETVWKKLEEFMEDEGGSFLENDDFRLNLAYKALGSLWQDFNSKQYDDLYIAFHGR